MIDDQLEVCIGGSLHGQGIGSGNFGDKAQFIIEHPDPLDPDRRIQTWYYRHTMLIPRDGDSGVCEGFFFWDTHPGSDRSEDQVGLIERMIKEFEAKKKP